MSEIKRLAAQNDGRPLGRARFEQATGIKESDWLGKIWPRWNDAIEEAGLSPNSMTEAYSEDDLLAPLVAMIREIGRFPTIPEQRLRRRRDPDFPPPDCIRRRWGTKGQVAARVMDYCLKIGGLDDVVSLCAPLATQLAPRSGVSELQNGQVYMLKHESAYKIGKSSDASRRYKEIRTQMPHDTEEIHVIDTDDINGIELYWHHRFRSRRLRGEWFQLTAEDVRAFKRRKFM